MKKDWVDAKNFRTRKLGKAFVSVSKKDGRIFFTSKAVKYLGEGIESVLFGFNDKGNFIIKGIRESDDRAFPFRAAGKQDKNNCSRQVNSKKFAEKILGDEKSGKYLAQWVAGDDLLEVDLSENFYKE